MSNDLKSPPEVSVVELVSGIITDVQVLITQQLAILHHEVNGEIGRAREAAIFVAVGLAIVVMGSVLFCEMLVHVLVSVAPELPLWKCYGIVGAPVTALGVVLCLVGIYRFRYSSTPAVDLARDLKENVNG